MIIEHIDRLPNGSRIIDTEGNETYKLGKCPYCGESLVFRKSDRTWDGFSGQWAVRCSVCNASTSWFPSKADAFENRVYDDDDY